MDKEHKYMVATRCYTYNHASYIEDTLRGFSMQDADFSMVYCIVDDASTDGEPDVLRKWAENNLDLKEDGIAYRKTLDYGEIIVAHLKKNSDSLFVIILLSSNHKQAGKSKLQYLSEWMDDSKYLALCEGDDYWSSPTKLQMQIGFLETHDGYGMCYTQCVSYYQNDNRFSEKVWGGKNESFEDFMVTSLVPTLTVVYSSDLFNDYLKDVKPEEKHWAMGDYPRWLWMSHESKVKFLPHVTGVYRVLENSASSRNDYSKALRFGASSDAIRRYFNEKFDYKISEKEFLISDFLFKMKTAARFNKMGDYFENWKQLIKVSPIYGFFYYKVYAYLFLFISKELRQKHS